MMEACTNAMGRRSGGCDTATRKVFAGVSRLLTKIGALRRGQDLTVGEWADFYLESFSKPPFRALKTHEVNQRALKHLRKMFENTKLADLTADDIEMYLRGRLSQRVRVKARDGFVEKSV